MVNTRNQNPLGAQSPLQSLSMARQARSLPANPPPRGATFPPGIVFVYDPNVGRYDDDVSELNLDDSVRAPAVLRSPSAESDGFVHIGPNEGDDERELSEPAVEIRFSDEEEEVVKIIDISSDEESESEDEISDLDLGGEPDENENEEEIAEPTHRFYGKIRIRQSILDRHAEEDANRPPLLPRLSFSLSPRLFSPNCNISSPSSPDHTDSDRTISNPPSSHHNLDDHDRTISLSPFPHNIDLDPDRTISLPPSPLNISVTQAVTDPDATISDPGSVRYLSPVRNQNEDEDDEMSDDGIVDYQPPPAIPFVNQNPSHFFRTYRGISTIWSVAEWAEDGEGVFAEEAAERERQRRQRRRRQNNGGQSALARRRAFRLRQQGVVPRARMNGRFA